jgi:biotin-(acetyl-CoA carboxylase) ligase
VRDDWVARAVEGALEVDGKRGLMRGLADDGALLFEDSAGALHKVYSGDVRFLERLSA